MSSEIVTIRPWKVGDENFILSTFLRGLYYGNDWFREIPKDIFMSHYHRVVERLLSHPGTAVRVACLREDEDVIVGYSISRPLQDGTSILDFVFVKSAWRKAGIGRSLLPPNFTSVSHLTKVGKSLKPVNCVFNPFTL